MSIRLSGMVSGMDTEAMVKELMSAQSMKKTKIENKKTKLEWKQEKWKDLNAKVYGLYTNSLTKMKMQSTFSLRGTTSSDSDVVTAKAQSGTAIGANRIKVQQLASSQYITGEKIAINNDEESSNKIDGNTSLDKIIGNETDTVIQIQLGDKKAVDIKIDEGMTVTDFVKKMKEAGINANFDTKQQRFFLSSKESGEDNAFTIVEKKIRRDANNEIIKDENGKTKYFDINEGVDENDTPNDKNVLHTLGLGQVTKSTDAQGKTTYSYDYDDNLSGDKISGNNFIAATSAIVTVNGVDFKDNTNEIEVNGVTYTLNAANPDKEVKIEITKDTSKVYDAVKEFVNEYNDVLKELNTVYSAKSAKDYDVLTDEQKEAMTEKQVEQWEKIIKDSLLRNDSTVSSLASTLRASIYTSTKVDGKVYSLSSIGITTSSDYSEKGLLHIHGDKDDKTYASDENKLQKMIDEDPDKLMEILNGFAKNLYDNLTNKMKSTSISSALTFYNDKQMNKELTTYKKQISDWETKLSKMEDRYYKQFSAMETALAKLNSQATNLANMFPS